MVSASRGSSWSFPRAATCRELLPPHDHRMVPLVLTRSCERPPHPPPPPPCRARAWHKVVAADYKNANEYDEYSDGDGGEVMRAAGRATGDHRRYSCRFRYRPSQ